MSQTVCPCCLRPFRAAKPSTVADTSTMSDAELYAHYKAIAPAADVASFLARATLAPDVRTDAEALASELRTRKLPRADVYRRLSALQDRWRRDDYWRRVQLPADRLARRLARARARRPALAIAA